MILLRIGIGAPASLDGPRQGRVDRFATFDTQGQKGLALLVGVADRPLGELAVVLMGEEHDADGVGEHHRGGLLSRELRVQLAPEGGIEGSRRGEVPHGQVYEDHPAHGVLLRACAGRAAPVAFR